MNLVTGWNYTRAGYGVRIMFNGINGIIKGSQRGHMRHKGAKFRRGAHATD